jgi:hypothetical protein
LTIVAIRTLDNPHPFDLLDRKFFDTLPWIADQLQPTNLTAIGEGDVPAIGGEFPARCFVFH